MTSAPDLIPLNSVSLTGLTDHRRRSPRAPVLRYGDFEDKFDSETLFFDLFRSHHEPHKLIALAPKLLNLTTELAFHFEHPETGHKLPHRIVPRISLDMIEIDTVDLCDKVILCASEFRTTLSVSESYAPIFADRKVAFTLQQDNDLVWIRDWADYNIHEHGADAIVIYDNASRRYDPTDLLDALRPIAAPDVSVSVVSWPFRYGPNDHRRPATLWYADSDFCQRGVLEHARLCLFPLAKGVLNTDIDELVYAETRAPLFDTLETCDAGYLEFDAIMIEAVSDDDTALNRHASYSRMKAEGAQESSTQKWAVAPRRTPTNVQWLQHSVLGAHPALESTAYRFGHMRAINTNWDIHSPLDTTERRTDAARDTETVSIPPLRAALDRVFPDRATGFIPTPDPQGAQPVTFYLVKKTPPNLGDETAPEIWYHRAAIAPSQGQSDTQALGFIEKAMTLAGTPLPHIEYAELYLECLLRTKNPQVVHEALGSIRDRFVPDISMQFDSLLATTALACGRIDDAHAAINRCFEKGAWHPGYLVRRAMIGQRQGRNDDARADLVRARVAIDDPRLIDHDIALRAQALSQSGLAKLPRSQVADFLGVEGILRSYIQFHRRHGLLTEAIEAGEDLCRRVPLKVGTWMLLAGLYRQAEETDMAKGAAVNALHLAQRNLQTGPEFHLGPIERGWWVLSRQTDLFGAYLEAGQPDHAKQAIETLLDRTDVGPDAVFEFLRGIARSTPIHPSYHAILSDLADKPTLGGLPPDLLADLQLARNHVDAARAVAQGIPDTETAMWIWGRILRRDLDARRFEQAADCAERLADLSPSQPQLINRAALLNLRADRSDRAWRIARDAVKRFPRDSGLHILRGRAALASGRNDGALRVLSQSHRLFPRDETIARLLEQATHRAKGQRRKV